MEAGWQAIALVGCKPADEKAFDETCASQFLAKSGRLLFRRPLTKTELAAYVDGAKAATARGQLHLL